MKTVNRSLTLAISLALSTAVYADGVDIYGKANLGFQSSDDGDGAFTELKSNASRIGLKGEQDLSDGLSVVYKAEFQVDMSDDEGDNIKARNQYVGLKGNFGEVLLGRNDSILKLSQGKIDQFNDYEADIKTLFKGENRLSDSVTYLSPSINNFVFGITYVAEDDKDGEDGYSVSASYGDSSLKKTKVYASLAMDKDIKGYDITRASVQGKVSDFILGAMYQTQESSSGSEADGYLVSANYKINKITLKGQYQTIDPDGGDSKSGISVGADYALGKNTKLFSFYSSFDNAESPDSDYLAVGMEYKF